MTRPTTPSNFQLDFELSNETFNLTDKNVQEIEDFDTIDDKLLVDLLTQTENQNSNNKNNFDQNTMTVAVTNTKTQVNNINQI